MVGDVLHHRSRGVVILLFDDGLFRTHREKEDGGRLLDSCNIYRYFVVSTQRFSRTLNGRLLSEFTLPRPTSGRVSALHPLSQLLDPRNAEK